MPRRLSKYTLDLIQNAYFSGLNQSLKMYKNLLTLFLIVALAMVVFAEPIPEGEEADNEPHSHAEGGAGSNAVALFSLLVSGLAYIL